MKNFYVVMAMLSSTALVSAQSLKDMEVVNNAANVKPIANVEQLRSVFVSPSAQAKAPAEDPQFNVYVVNGQGMYASGVTADFMSYEASICFGAIGKDAWFNNYAGVVDGVNYTWKYSDGASYYEMETNADKSAARMIPYVTTYYPELEGVGGTTKKSFVKTDYATDAQGKPVDVECIVSPAVQRSRISMSDPRFCGNFVTRVKMDDAGDDIRAFGDYVNEGQQVNKIFGLFHKTNADIVVYGADIILYSESQVPQDKNLTLQFYEYNADNQASPIGTKYGETSVSTADLKDLGEGLYSASFEFVDYGMGIPVEMPIIIPENKQFIGMVSGFEGTGLISIANSANGFTGSAYYTFEDGTISTIGYGNAPEIPSCHLTLTLDVEIPSAIFGYSIMDVPVLGGSAYVPNEDNSPSNIVYTSEKFDDDEKLEVVYPDWVKDPVFNEVTQDQYGWDEIHAYEFTCRADALPNGVNARQGFIEIKSAVTENVVARLEIGQGEWTPSGVETVKVAKASVAVAGDNFQLTYGEEFNAVSVYNVAGSKVASYALPQGGSFEVPAAELNGVYMFVFEGQEREVVKVVK